MGGILREGVTGGAALGRCRGARDSGKRYPAPTPLLDGGAETSNNHERAAFGLDLRPEQRRREGELPEVSESRRRTRRRARRGGV
jgi:hypothetical protein